jgi:hypothetical protein
MDVITESDFESVNWGDAITSAIPEGRTREDMIESHDWVEGEYLRPKFDSVAAFKLHRSTLDSGQDDDHGNVIDWHRWSALFRDVTGVDGGPCAILHADPQGFVSAEWYEDPAEAEKAWAELEEEWDAYETSWEHEGSILSGTTRERDRIPAFFAALLRVDGHRAATLARKYGYNPELSDSWMDSTGPDAREEFLNDLDTALNNAAPETHYFGTAEGNDSDFGFWRIDD